MIHLNSNDMQVTRRASELLEDDMAYNDGYTEADYASAAKLKLVGGKSQVLIVTGDDVPDSAALGLLADIVMAEMDYWVEDASQRLIRRASLALGIPAPTKQLQADHGIHRGDHALIPDWFAGIYMLRCSTCQRMFSH